MQVSFSLCTTTLYHYLILRGLHTAFLFVEYTTQFFLVCCVIYFTCCYTIFLPSTNSFGYDVKPFSRPLVLLTRALCGSLFFCLRLSACHLRAHLFIPFMLLLFWFYVSFPLTITCHQLAPLFIHILLPYL